MSSRGPILLGLGLATAALLLRAGSRAQDAAPSAQRARDLLDQVTDRARARAAQLSAALEGWPLPPEAVLSLGDDARAVREAGPHHGLDLRAAAGTDVIAPEPLRVIRVVNGTGSVDEHKRRAGLWVDGEGQGGRILRFLHLASGSVVVKAGDLVPTGGLIGKVAATGDSGVQQSGAHLHFEVRRPGTSGQAYGGVINPVDVLPTIGKPNVLIRLAALRARSPGVVS